MLANVCEKFAKKRAGETRFLKASALTNYCKCKWVRDRGWSRKVYHLYLITICFFVFLNFLSICLGHRNGAEVNQHAPTAGYAD